MNAVRLNFEVTLRIATMRDFIIPTQYSEPAYGLKGVVYHRSAR